MPICPIPDIHTIQSHRMNLSCLLRERLNRDMLPFPASRKRGNASPSEMMSALGHKRTFAVQNSKGHVRLTPESGHWTAHPRAIWPPTYEFTHAYWFRASKGCFACPYFLRPRSINNRTASDRLKLCSAAHRSTRAISVSERRRPIIGRTPVEGRPRFFCLTNIDRFIFCV